jgi:hypothetical protein
MVSLPFVVGRARGLHIQQERKEAADLLRPLRIAVGVFAQGRALAAASAVEKLLGKLLHQVTLGTRCGHACLLESGVNASSEKSDWLD